MGWLRIVTETGKHGGGAPGPWASRPKATKPERDLAVHIHRGTPTPLHEHFAEAERIFTAHGRCKPHTPDADSFATADSRFGDAPHGASTRTLTGVCNERVRPAFGDHPSPSHDAIRKVVTHVCTPPSPPR